MKKSFSKITAWIVIVVMVFIVGLFYFESIKTERTIPYSKFEQYWINDEVQSIKISEGSLAIEGTLKNREQFVTIVPQNRLNLLFDKYRDVFRSLVFIYATVTRWRKRKRSYEFW